MKLQSKKTIGFTRILIIMLLVLLIHKSFAQSQPVTVTSPDKRITLTVFIKNNKLQYQVSADGKMLINPSRLGLVIDSVDLGSNAHMAGPVKSSRVDESYTLIGNHTTAKNLANEADIPLTAMGRQMSVIARVYNDGAAIRYTLPAGSKYIDGERTEWQLPASVSKLAWADSSQSYEGLNHVTTLQQVPQGGTIMAPVTCQSPGYFVSISEADCESFSDMALKRDGNGLTVNYPFAKSGWAVKAPKANIYLNGMYKGRAVSPWRTTLIARTLSDLVNSDLMMNLCPPPPAGSDFSWVKPGRCLWQWWSVGAPKFDEQKNWYDAAAKLKWEYYLVDDGWRNWKQDGKNQWALLKEVIDYGKSVGVKSIVWVDSKEFRHAPERKAYLDKVKASGADGIKIDFIPDATADIMQWYAETQQECAALKLLLNFHGSVKPTGLRRTFPNDLTREAIRGNEYQMTRYHRVMPPQHDVTVPFTRLLAGPADFTPVILNPKELSTAGFTWPHEFAQAIVYLSPITHFADSYQYYLDSPMFDLFQQLPTTWDETRVLTCTSMGDAVGFARRKGSTWWIGVMNGGTARDITIPLDFLKQPTQATLIYDGDINAAVNRKEQKVSGQTTLKINLRAGGGFVAKL